MRVTDEDRLRVLTPKQREVLDMLLAGSNDGEIAEALGMAKATAKVHVQAIFIGFGVRQRTRLMARLMVPRYATQEAESA